MARKKFLHLIFRVLALLFLSVYAVSGQNTSHIPGKILIVMQDGYDIATLTRDIPELVSKNAAISVKKLQTAPMTVYAIQFNHHQTDESRLLSEIRSRRDVKLAQFDHYITDRVIPDDPRFNLQWQYINDGSENGKEGADIDMELAWDITTGGTTANGDTIVVCIIDSGMDESHQDFSDNLWKNHREIPDNGMDDDENGYVDDYNGWSVYTSNDDIFNNNSHGTAVAGIVGAKGNNGIGVSGVNWNVKLMIIRGGGSESQALESYAYPYKMRKLYNETNGNKGAFVVATNASWGTDLLHWEDAPIWCAFYDTLGSAGILNCGATSNSNVNVDLQGDMPTSCPSDYLVTVTNLNRADNKVNQAGYGLETIDLGAYGQSTYTTTNNNSYTSFGGTSGATPHVTGTVALLYSMNCHLLSDLALENPSAAALFVKDLILNGVVPNESLDGKTVTGGRLNALNPLLMLQNLCSGCAFPFSVKVDSLGGNTAVLSWEKTSLQQSFDVIFKPEYALEWDTLYNIQNQLVLDTLSYCTTYQMRIKSNCTDTFSVYSFEFKFTTDGCCVLPQSYQFEVSESLFSVELEDVLAADQYAVEYKKFGDFNWEIRLVDDRQFDLEVLDTCYLYYFRYKSLCANGEETAFSPIYQLRGDCGDCEIDQLCSFGGSNSFEFIDTVFIGDFVNASGRGSKGQETFNDVTAYTFESGKNYILGVKPGFISTTIYKEFIKIYLDLNADGSLSEDELLLDLVAESGEKVEGQITIPKDIKTSTTTLRVKLLYNNTTDPCLDVPFGETEDYCVELFARGDCLNGNFEMDTIFVEEEKAEITWIPLDDAQHYLFRLKPDGSEEWKYGLTYNHTVLLDSLEKCTTYEFALSALCMEQEGDFSDVLVFKTDCGSSTERFYSQNMAVSLQPNPFSGSLTLL
ncbi:MAG TPA: S8 family serine peptidase, partial [Saprospiraceae bacterium]|nr:S8 family serine peptidase [Saprospiraceae bacterium]